MFQFPTQPVEQYINTHLLELYIDALFSDIWYYYQIKRTFYKTCCSYYRSHCEATDTPLNSNKTISSFTSTASENHILPYPLNMNWLNGRHFFQELKTQTRLNPSEFWNKRATRALCLLDVVEKPALRQGSVCSSSKKKKTFGSRNSSARTSIVNI